MDFNVVQHDQYQFNRDAFLRSLASSPFSGLERAFLLGPVPAKDRLKPENVKMIVFGILTALMYTFLIKYQDLIVNFANLTHEGNHIYFSIPILIALAFSYVHGAFTANFWESLDVRSKKEKGTK